MASTTTTVADYLLTRLKQNGIESIFGVPGDYNLTLLDYIEPQGIKWIGTCNELNAGYAADASARVKGLGALITTFGVGELSATNAIAGAFAELAPLVHIVGTPARKLQQERAKVHHTFNDGEYKRFAQMSSHITVAQADLSDPRTCGALIDATLLQCLLHSRPVYIALPADMVPVKIDAQPLETRLVLPKAPSSADEDAALRTVLDRMHASQRPMILVDGESLSYGIVDELNTLAETTQWPVFVTTWGKSLVDESLPNFRGTWRGDAASLQDKAFVKERDLILCFGPHYSNTNSFGYSSIPSPEVTISFIRNAVQTGDNGQSFRDLPVKTFLTTLTSQLNPSNLAKIPPPPTLQNGEPSINHNHLPPNDALTQSHFYASLNKHLRPGDIILAETGTAAHGCRDFHLPRHTLLLKPATWLSIGYMLPATLGAGLAQRELHARGKWHTAPRTVLLQGDGSFQMTAQELSTIIAHRLNVLFILINNDGYTIERCLHGYAQAYNDVARWRYLDAPGFFGADANKGKGEEYRVVTAQARTWGELEDVLSAKDGDGNDGRPMLKMVEVFMDKLDAPETLLAYLNRQR